MTMNESLRKDHMYQESEKRLELMGISLEERQNFLQNRSISFKIRANHEEKWIRREEVTEEERQWIKEMEEKYNFLCYYAILDEGMWPDGCTFPRFTLLYVGEDSGSYRMVKEDCIKKYETIPAYIINLEDRSCSEFAEICFRNIRGNLINIS